ncbi:MAG TPA: hypothetical protein VHE09_05060 [Rhizomicrobium sp.]|nr:hypothetical protein [Rhizomicrobium sp.]
MRIEEDIVADLASSGYHPRTSRHSDRQSYAIVEDLLDSCPILRDRARDGEIVAKLRHHQQVGHDDWVIDLAIGTCAGNPEPPQGARIGFTEPALIQIAIELKSIYTEHGKARRNRLRDFNAFHGYAHQYNPRTIAAAFLVVNAARYFYSPLRKPDDITEHGGRTHNTTKLATDCVDLFRTIHLRNSPADQPGLEAIGVVVIEHDNLAVHPEPNGVADRHSQTRIAPAPPSLRVGDPLHYQTMIQRICVEYNARFR